METRGSSLEQISGEFGERESTGAQGSASKAETPFQSEVATAGISGCFEECIEEASLWQGMPLCFVEV